MDDARFIRLINAINGEPNRKRLASPVLDWGIEDVARWLEELEFMQYSSVFRSTGITGDSLFRLSINDLVNMGFETFDHIQQLLNHIQDLKYSMDEYATHVSYRTRSYHSRVLRRVHISEQLTQLKEDKDRWHDSVSKILYYQVKYF
eukprot:TRINITY_DN3311_c0_g1_i1.p1 TRINITY_DN3311_c0_g1~~TRINITY_DN3311_c0_g1_i1.p1  ORF type:complete len:147 (-),score=3.21 TRINITY_DN3311_c0_g1_i1:50-490(-)